MRRFSSLMPWTIILSLALSSCGGGGSSSDQFAGVWSGGASLVGDTCNLFSPESSFISFTHLVNQNDDTVALDNGLVTFLGSVTGSDSFSVDAERPFRSLFERATCTEHINWRYDAIERDTANFVVRKSTITCSVENTTTSCEYAFSGTAFRSGGQPIPIDVGIGGTVDSGSDSTAVSTGSVPETSL